MRYGRGKNLLVDQLTCRVDWGEGVERVKVFFDVLTIERENTFIAKVQQTNERTEVAVTTSHNERTNKRTNEQTNKQTNERTNVAVTTSHNVCLKRIKN